MDTHGLRMAHEIWAKTKIANYLGVPEKMVNHVSASNPISPYDIEFKGMKFDVKYSHPVVVARGKVPVWDFDIRKTIKEKRVASSTKYCDFFFLIGMTNGIPKKVFLVPYSAAPTTHLRITIKGETKYSQYAI